MMCVVLLGAPLAFPESRDMVLGRLGERRVQFPLHKDILILYDVDETSEWNGVGEIHARMLANLLGHFPFSYAIKAVDDYESGDVQGHRATFYLGSLYGRDLPPEFIIDVLGTTNTVCWFKYNWELIDRSFVLVRGDGTIRYRGMTFTKHPADLELGSINFHSKRCEVLAWAGSQGKQIPYISRKGNLWYVADLPFSYISERDRYLVFADVLHDIVGVNHIEEPRALLRIEDVDPRYPPGLLKEVADCLYERSVPFAVSMVPVYCDPLGQYNSGASAQRAISDPESQEFVDALRYMERKGGHIFLHGYTHQYKQIRNPWSGVTGDDFEFYLVEEDEDKNLVFLGPVPEDSFRWVSRRVRLAKNELRAVGLSEAGWVTPHYTASPLDYRYFASAFPVTIQRVLYVGRQHIVERRGDNSSPVSEIVSQFFPYVIEADVYGQRILPENVGYFDPENWPVDAMVEIADTNRALREPWASMFFHPFFDISHLEELVERIQELGYTFVAPSSYAK
jgi:uncharacterized protein YdaL